MRVGIGASRLRWLLVFFRVVIRVCGVRAVAVHQLRGTEASATFPYVPEILLP